MVKVADNELLHIWNNVCAYTDNSKNELFTQSYFRKTKLLELKNATVICSRKLNDEEYIIMTYKNIIDLTFTHNIYSLVIINIKEDYPIERSRIIKYCTISEDIFDLVNIILTHKLNQVINLLNKAIDEKFTYLINNNFNIMRYRLGKSDIQNILVKPDRSGFDVPSLSSIMSQYNSQEYSIDNSHIDNSQEYNLKKFNKPEKSIIKQEVINPIIHPDKLYNNLNIIREEDLFKIVYKDEQKSNQLNNNENIVPEVVEKQNIPIFKNKIEDKFIISEMSEDINISNLIDSVSTNIKPKQLRTKEFIF